MPTKRTRTTRKKLSPPESLAGFWERGLAPPAWAYQPGEHREALIELFYFGSDAMPHPRRHPARREWFLAFQGSR